ncbi:MAG: substrate-binding domain-containing protein [Burkholderiaceae bacterium]|jgi:molybdate transport system substrate-binding protein
MAEPIRIISSMATRQLLTELLAAFGRQSPQPVQLESVGGVDAAKRVQAGEAFDIVALASDAIDKLIEAGHLAPHSRVDLVRSGVAVAVRASAPRPDIGSGEAVRRAVLAARTLGYSTGPSGVQLARQFERWGIADTIKDRIVQAPPGVPVGRLVAEGQVELGFQQLSELMNLPGIEVLGPLPDDIQITTTFSAAVSAACARPDAARALLAFMAAPAMDAIKRRNGMEPA